MKLIKYLPYFFPTMAIVCVIFLVFRWVRYTKNLPEPLECGNYYECACKDDCATINAVYRRVLTGEVDQCICYKNGEIKNIW